MKLINLLKNIEFQANKEIKDIDIKNISYNSADAGEGVVFTAIEGETRDGHEFVDHAYKKGSRVFIVSKDLDLASDSIIIRVENTRKALSVMSSNFFDNPSKKLKVIGITGTKGKTTISNYIKSIFEEAGISAGLIGTNGVFYNNITEETKNTTPESYELHRIINNMVKSGINLVVMEVSSGGLKMKRVDDIDFDLAVFTNITRDHIGPKEHPDFNDYLESKAKLFKLAGSSIINIDDSYGQYMRGKSKGKVETYSIEKCSDIMAVDVDLSKDLTQLGSTFLVKSKDNRYRYNISSPGEFSVYNALASIAVARHFSIADDLIAKVLRDVKVSGRAEVLSLLDYASIVLDYAHNEVSLNNIVETLRTYKPKRLICIIGSVGNRSILRRRELGDIAAEKCDICILTSDNPDFEDPMNIINEMSESFKESSCILIKEKDRRKAIRKGVSLLKHNDILLLAGKGHEQYQLIKGEKLHFSDKETVIE